MVLLGKLFFPNKRKKGLDFKFSRSPKLGWGGLGEYAFERRRERERGREKEREEWRKDKRKEKK